MLSKSLRLNKVLLLACSLGLTRLEHMANESNTHTESSPPFVRRERQDEHKLTTAKIHTTSHATNSQQEQVFRGEMGRHYFISGVHTLL
jgi:hypothetical protein